MTRALVLVGALVLAGSCGGHRSRSSGPAPGETHAQSESESESGSASVSGAGSADVDSMDRASLERAHPAAKGERAQQIALRLALIAEHTGDIKAALAWLDKAGAAPRAADLAAAIRRQQSVDPSHIAVLLPLTGKHAAIGRELRVAIELAAAGAAGRGAALHVHDTRGDAALAERLVDRAADAGAIAILGPVGRAESAAAAARASLRRVPIALLAPDAAGAAPDAGVFRLWPAPEWEASEAARIAAELGHDRLAILAPRDDDGAAQTDAFARAAAAAGVAVVAAGTYDPTGSDLEPDVKAFLGLDPMKNERLRRHLRAHGGKDGWKTFSPDIGFDVLYVPDDHTRAALIASYLPYFNIEVRNSDVMDTMSLRRKHGGRLPSVVQLLGSSGWYHPGLLTRGGAAVDGALIVVPCAVGAATDELGVEVSDAAAEFAERFEAQAGRSPGPVAGQAHDAALLLLGARAAARSRAGLQGALARASITDGACGAAHLAPTGQLARAAGLVQVDGDEFVPFAP
jgi:ABC-type branched-subunit amino acid transport system substrate-binding protein